MVIEASEFKTRPGISDAHLLAASQAAQDGYLATCRGFVSRDLLKTDDGTWLDLVRFETLEDAQASFAGFVGQPSTKAFEEAIDPESVRVRHFEVAGSYQARVL